VRKILSVVLRAYFYIGAVLGMILLGSYHWGLGWGAPGEMGFMAKFWTQLTLEPVFIFSAFVRMFLWLPSLIAWMMAPGETSFIMWLAPGVYTDVIQASP
jgi:hypothetical protein